MFSISLACVHLQVLQRLFLAEETSTTVGKGLLRPIHDRQLREAAKGLAVCAMHKVMPTIWSKCRIFIVDAVLLFVDFPCAVFVPRNKGGNIS